MNPPHDVTAWLATEGLEELAPLFTQNYVTMEILPSLSSEDLREMGITAMGHRKRILGAIAELGAPKVLPSMEASTTSPALVAIPVESAVIPVALSDRPAPLPLPDVALRTPAGLIQAKLWPPLATARPEVVPSPEIATDHSVASPSKKPKRKGFSAGFLAVSIALHILLGLGAGYWVVQQINAKRKLQFAAGPPTVSPSKRALEHKVSLQKKKNAGGAPAQARRIAVTGLAANITLPEMPAMPNSSTQIVAGRMSGMGGAGFGTGMGFGNGSGMGVGGMGKGGLGLTMFGARGGLGLTGYFYDLKQTKDGKPTDMAPKGNVSDAQPMTKDYQSILRKFTQNWDTSVLAKYYRSQSPLVATQIYVTNGPSDEAAKAFGEEKKCSGYRWIVHYKGSATAPKDGSFRFIGRGDNVMVVRLNGKIVLDGGYDGPYTVASEVNTDTNLGPGGPRDWTLAGGAWFSVRRGELMKLEILIGDGGGLFSDYLLIEEKGVKYDSRKDAPGALAYPIFQLATTAVPKEAGKNGNPQPASKQLVFPATGSVNVLEGLRR